ncbi:MAG: hypothetical protein FJ125_09390, partial [Deltaproteobacteria bacterium]|nr:hypothetical protein [Deltaproteobacteria bacterium]
MPARWQLGRLLVQRSALRPLELQQGARMPRRLRCGSRVPGELLRCGQPRGVRPLRGDGALLEPSLCDVRRRPGGLRRLRAGPLPGSDHGVPAARGRGRGRAMTRHPSPAALRALPAALALALPVLMPGCSSQLSLPEGAQVRCDGSAPCPSGHVCRTELGRCVRAGGADSAAPGLEAGSVAIEPALARRDAAVLVRFRASEPLGAPPGLQLRLPDPVAVPLAPGPTPDDPDLPTFLFRYETTGREPQGVPFDLVAQLVDRAGNVAREVPVGQLAFDFAPPRLQEAAALGPATLRPGATARLLLRSSEELVRAPQIRRAPGGVPHPCEPTWQEHGYACSEELPPTCEEGPLSLDVALEDLAGNVGQHTLAELFRVDATAPAGLDVRAQQWLELLYSPTGWSGSAGEPHGELRVCPPPVSRPSEERPPSGEEGPRSEGERPESGRRERADPWSWCPAGLRPAEALEPGALLIVTAAAWIGGELRCGEQELGRARLDPDPGQGLVLPLAPPTSEACVALEDEAGNRSPASPVERIELALTASSQPRPGALRVEERPLFGGQLEPEGRSPLVAGDRLALPDDGLVAVTHGAGRWQQPSLARPAERWGHVLARDTARGRSLLFGGQNPRRLDDTWEWDGRSWLPVRLPEDGEAPQARAFAALAWDAARGKAVLFGGEGAEGLLDDTWEWNGKSWSRCRILPGVDGPTPRRRHALVYDGASRMVLLFGGEDRDGQRLADAWRWDGERWQPIPRSTGEPATGWPEPRAEHALAYDRAQRLVVLYGGRRHEGPDGDLADTWGWDGRIWRE